MINNVVLTGRLVADAELRYTPQGDAVANLRIAVQRNFKNGQGEYEADFISLVAWRATAEVIANHLRKGSLAGFEGRLQTRQYENDEGKTVYVTEVNVHQVTFLEKKEDEKPKQKQGNGKYNKR